MDLFFANLNIKKIIIHQIYEKMEDKTIKQPRYSSSFTILDAKGMEAFQDRVVNAIGGKSHSIEMDIENASEASTFQTCSKMIRSESGIFVEKSKQIAYKLAESQNSRKIPGGIVVIFEGTIGPNSNTFIGIIKAEIHGGFTMNENDDKLILQYVSNLLLTPQQKLYKIALFIETNTESCDSLLRDSSDFKVFIYDSNIDRSETKEAASYFYQTFLGCSFVKSSKRLTQDFYEKTREYISSLPVDDENKVDLNTALYTYLKTSQNTIIQVADFADQYLQTEFQDNYSAYMKNNEFPQNAVSKDLTNIANRLKRRKLRFSSEVDLTAPSDKFKELVEFGTYDGEKTTLKIAGKLKEH